MPSFRKNWLFYLLFFGVFIVLISLMSTKVDKRQMNIILETIVKQGNNILKESRRTNDLLTKISKTK